VASDRCRERVVVGPQAVADAIYRPDPLPVRFAELAPQVADVDVDRVRLADVVEAQMRFSRVCRLNTRRG